MEPIERFVSTLRRGGIDLVRAQTILREKVGAYPDDVVRRWLEGDILPGLSIRGHLFEAATQDPEDIAWECSTFLGPVPESLVPGVNELCEAARRNEPERLALALGGGVVIDGWDEGCDYALGYAAERGHAGIARALLRFGADSITFAKGKSNAYLRALQSGNAPMLRDFLSFGAARLPRGGADLNALLVVAGSAADNPEMIAALDTHGRFEHFSFGFALAEAAKHGRFRNAGTLVKLGAAVDARDASNRTPLMNACASGHLEIAALIIDAGASINPVDREGNTALHDAARCGHADIVRRLLEQGADSTLSNASGERAIDLVPEVALEARDALSSPPVARGPSWLDLEGTPVMFLYNKGFGLGFDPRVLDRPILYGGDHFGIYHVDAKFLNSESRRAELESFQLSWFLEYVERLVRGVDFSMDELMRAARAKGMSPSSRADLPKP